MEETVLFACEYDEQPLDFLPVRTYQFFTSPQRILCNCAAVLLLIVFYVLYFKYQDPLYIVCVSILFYFIGEPFFRYHRAKKTLLAGFEESRVIRGGIEHFHVCFSDASFKVSAKTGKSSRAGYELGYDQIKLTLYSKEYAGIHKMETAEIRCCFSVLHSVAPDASFGHYILRFQYSERYCGSRACRRILPRSDNPMVPLQKDNRSGI